MGATRNAGWLKRLAFDRGGALTIAALAFYVWQACPYVVELDNAEFSTLGAAGGGAHPSGYPLYVVWLRLWSWLPTSAAHAASIATAVLGASAIAILHAACRAWGARPLAATLATGAFAAAPLVARYHTTAEAFALNNLIVACVLWLAAATGPVRGTRRAIALGLVAGLGMTNHMTCALLAPVGLLGLARAAAESSRRWTAVVAASAAYLVGLAPYAYLFVAPENLQAWPHPDGLGGLFDIILRRDYGGAFSFSGGDSNAPVVDHLVELARSIGRSWLWIAPALAFAVLGRRLAKPGRGESRAAWAALTASFLLAGPLLATRFDTPVNWVGGYIVHRFHLIPILILTIPIAVGLDSLAARLRLPAIADGALGVAAFGAIAATSLPYLARFHSPAIEHGARNMLRSLPPNSVVMATIELDVTARYLQLTQRERPDVLIVRIEDMAIGWYRARFAAYGIRWQPTPDAQPDLDLARYLLDLGRPVFVHPQAASLIARFPSYRHGTLVRLVPDRAAVPALAELEVLNRAIYDAFDLDYSFPGGNDEFATQKHREYASTWKQLGDQRSRSGLSPAEDYERARKLGR